MSRDTYTIDGTTYHPTEEQWGQIQEAWAGYCDTASQIDEKRRERQRAAGSPLVLDDDFTESRKAANAFYDRVREILGTHQPAVL